MNSFLPRKGLASSTLFTRTGVLGCMAACMVLTHSAQAQIPPTTDTPPVRWTPPGNSPIQFSLFHQSLPYSQIIALAPPSSSTGRIAILEHVITLTNKVSTHQIRWLSPPQKPSSPWSAPIAATLPSPAQGIACGYGGVFVSTTSRLLFLQDTNHDGLLESSRVLFQGLTPDNNTSARYSHLQWGPDGALYGILLGAGFKDLPSENASSRDAIHLNPGVIRYYPSTGKLEPVADGPAQLIGLSVELDRAIRVFRNVPPTPLNLLPGATYLPPDGYPPPWNPSALAMDLPAPGIHTESTPATTSWISLSPPILRRGPSGWTESRLALHASGKSLLWVPNASPPFPFLNSTTAPPGSVEIALPPGLSGLALSTIPDGTPCLLTRHLHSGVDQLWSIQPTSPPASGAEPSPENTPEFSPSLLREEIRFAYESPSTQRVARLTTWATAPPSTAQPHLQTASLWALHGLNALSNETWTAALRSSSPAVRESALLIASEKPSLFSSSLPILQARLQDPEVEVRRAALLGIASACESLQPENDASRRREIPREWLSLWEVAITAAGAPVSSPEHALAWRATESLFLCDPLLVFEQLAQKAASDTANGMSLDLVRRTVKRAFATGRQDLATAIVDRIENLTIQYPAVAVAALEGMADGQRGSKRWTHYKRASRLLATLSSNSEPQIAQTAERLEALAGNPETQKRILNRIQDSNAPTETRLQAIQFAQNFNSQASRLTLLQFLQQPFQPQLHPAAIQAISQVGKREEARALLALWPQWNTEMRRETSSAFANRHDWLPLLVDALESRKIAPEDLGDDVKHSIRQSPDPEVRLRGIRQITRKP